MAMLARALTDVKSNVSQFLPDHVIHDAAREVGHAYRDRKLGPVRTVLLLVLQLFAANASLAHARALGGYTFSVSALAQARGRLPVALLRRVLAWLVARVVTGDGAGGPRVVLLDAFNVYAPDTPALRKAYRRPRQGKRSRCDYPQVRTVAVFDLASGLLLARHHFRSDRHESPQLPRLLDAALAAGVVRPGDVVVFDRGFVAYANLCLLVARGVHVVARLAKGLHARRGTGRTRVARLGTGDTLVRWAKPRQRPPKGPTTPGEWAALPAELSLRQLTVTAAPGGAGHRSRRLTLVTSLTDAATHPAATIAGWYRRRWEVETDVRHLKQTMNLEFLRARTPANVERELLLRAIAYNLVRLAMLRSAELRGTADDPGRVSFADACRWLSLAAATGVPLLALRVNPLRPRTSRPRQVKYRGKNYRVLTTKPAPQSRVA